MTVKETPISLHDQIYTCPMHPEVVRNNPGDCPICGMVLEPKTVSLEVTENKEFIDISRRFWLSVILTIPILILTMGGHIPGLSTIVHLISAHFSSWVQFILATVVTIWCGWPLLKRGGLSVIEMHLNMFTLIALGTSIAYIVF